eukprot:3117785-Prymnesium_polylepis.3
MLRVSCDAAATHGEAANAADGRPAGKRLSKAEKRELKAERMKEKRQQWRARTRESHREKVQQRQMEREAKLAAMSPEERAAHDAREKEERDRSYRERCEQTARIDRALANGLRYGHKMTPKEQGSLSRQLGRCWAANRRAAAPVSLHLTALGTCPDACLPKENAHRSWKVHCVDADVTEHFAPNELVFLTPDADDVLQELDQSKARSGGAAPSSLVSSLVLSLVLPLESTAAAPVTLPLITSGRRAPQVYVISGLVDTSVQKRTSLTKAQGVGVATARLPLNEHGSVRGVCSAGGVCGVCGVGGVCGVWR